MVTLQWVQIAKIRLNITTAILLLLQPVDAFPSITVSINLSLKIPKIDTEKTSLQAKIVTFNHIFFNSWHCLERETEAVL